MAPTPPHTVAADPATEARAAATEPDSEATADDAHTPQVEILDADALAVEGLSEDPDDDLSDDPTDDGRAPTTPGPSSRQPAPLLPALRSSGRASRRGDILGYYLSEVRRYPLLEPEEEKELAIQYQETGDPEAAQRLVTSNLRLVVKLAYQYHRQWANVLDLIQEGNVGLVEALSRYDPYRGIRFSSYAQYWIRAMILRFLMDNYRMVRLGSTRHGRKLFFQLQKERDHLIKQGIHPSTLALSKALNVPEHEVINVDQHLSAPALSLDAPTGASGEGRPLSEVVGSKRASNPETNVARSELGEVFRAQLAVFETTLRDERERTIWHERLTATEPVSLTALGKRYGVSKERIRQVEARMKRRLREHLTKELGDEIPIYLETPSTD